MAHPGWLSMLKTHIYLDSLMFAPPKKNHRDQHGLKPFALNSFHVPFFLPIKKTMLSILVTVVLCYVWTIALLVLIFTTTRTSFPLDVPCVMEETMNPQVETKNEPLRSANHESDKQFLIPPDGSPRLIEASDILQDSNTNPTNAFDIEIRPSTNGVLQSIQHVQSLNNNQLLYLVQTQANSLQLVLNGEIRQTIHVAPQSTNPLNRNLSWICLNRDGSVAWYTSMSLSASSAIFLSNGSMWIDPSNQDLYVLVSMSNTSSVSSLQLNIISFDASSPAPVQSTQAIPISTSLCIFKLNSNTRQVEFSSFPVWTGSSSSTRFVLSGDPLYLYVAMDPLISTTNPPSVKSPSDTVPQLITRPPDALSYSNSCLMYQISKQSGTIIWTIHHTNLTCTSIHADSSSLYLTMNRSGSASILRSGGIAQDVYSTSSTIQSFIVAMNKETAVITWLTSLSTDVDTFRSISSQFVTKEDHGSDSFLIVSGRSACRRIVLNATSSGKSWSVVEPMTRILDRGFIMNLEPSTGNVLWYRMIETNLVDVKSDVPATLDDIRQGLEGHVVVDNTIYVLYRLINELTVLDHLGTMLYKRKYAKLPEMLTIIGLNFNGDPVDCSSVEHNGRSSVLTTTSLLYDDEFLYLPFQSNQFQERALCYVDASQTIFAQPTRTGRNLTVRFPRKMKDRLRSLLLPCPTDPLSRTQCFPKQITLSSNVPWKDVPLTIEKCYKQNQKIDRVIFKEAGSSIRLRWMKTHWELERCDQSYPLFPSSELVEDSLVL